MAEEKLLKSTSWKYSQLHGSCGVFELYRLKASYETETERDHRLAILRNEAVPIIPVLKGNTLSDQLRAFTDSSMGWSIPVEWGFTAVLDKLYNGTKANLIVMTDNIDDDGDVHIGPFGTKHFAKWVMENDLGDVHETPPRKSHRGRQPHLQVWVWHPNWENISTIITKCRMLALEYYKEIKNVEKEFEALRANANADLLRTLSQAAGWE